MTGANDAAGRWTAARDDLVPAVGERVADLISCALLGAAGLGSRADEIAERLRQQGDDPEAPVVTEVEGVLIEWARTAGSGSAPDPALTARLQAATSPALRERLDELAVAARALAA